MNTKTASLLLLLSLLWIPCGAPAAGQSSTGTAERERAWALHRRMKESPVDGDLEWRAVGPRLQGGRIEAIAVAPGDPGTMYVGPGSGNVWKTRDAGMSWTPIFENESAFAIGDIALAPSNPAHVWVGTGETQPRHSGYTYAGTGVFRSTDAGATWRHVGLSDTHHIGKVVVHPTDPETVYVAAIGHFWSTNEERGVFRTTDGGKSWEKVLFVSERTGVVDLVIDPLTPKTLYAWAWQVTKGEESGLYKSTDGGTSWRKIGRGLPEGPTGRAGLDVFRSDPSILYAFIDDHSPYSGPAGRGRRRAIVGGSVYRSDDHGESWRRVNQDDLFRVYTVYGWKFCDVRISPDDADEIYVLGNRAFRSIDGGRTYKRIGEQILRLHDTQGEVMHLDHHELWINPEDSGHLVLGNDGGMFVSRDHGATWLHLNNLPIGEFYFVAIDDRDPLTIYGGTQDNGALYGPATSIHAFKNDPWRHVYLDRWTGGDAFVTLPDPTRPGIVYYEHQHGAMMTMDLTVGNVLSGGPATESIRPRAPRGEPRWRFGWYTPFVISHHNPRTLYAGGNKVLESKDRGRGWRAISPDLADEAGGPWAAVPTGTITMISESRFRPGVIYVGTEGGSVHVTTTGGEEWTKISEGLPRKWVSRVEASRHEERRVYVSMTGYREDDFAAYLFVSDDSGGRWRSIAEGLPSESINVVREDPHDPRRIYVGTDGGVYRSDDLGRSWGYLGKGLPTTPVHDLVVSARTGQVVAATHGRSMFVLDPPADASRSRPGDRRDRMSADTFRGFRFRSLGPSLTSGRVADVEVDPNDANVWYVAAGSGGLWKTVNRGNTWTPIFDDHPSYSLGCVKVDPRNSSVVWLGTGENTSNRSVGYGDGIYKSTDAGRTWRRVGLENSEHIQCVVIDPRDSDVIYVASQGPLWAPGGDRGLYKTTDGGETWKRALHVSEDTGITDVVLDTQNPDVIYAAAYQRRRAVGQTIGGGPEAGIFKSTDGGKTWERLRQGLPSCHLGRIALAVDTRRPGRVYALVVAQRDEGGFFVSDDAGANWTRASDYSGGDPQYYGEIFVDPHRADTIWALDVLFNRSQDGGRSFRSLRFPIHVDQHDLVFDDKDPKHLLVGNDGGLYETRDGGDTWRHFTNLPLSQFYRVGIDGSRPFYNVAGGSQDNGTIMGPSRTRHRVGIRTSEWRKIGGGDGFQARFDPEDPNIVYRQSQNGALGRLDLRTGQSRSIRPPRRRGTAQRWHWDSPLIISPHAPRRLYYAGNRLYRSDDRGDSWTPVSPDLTRNLDRDAIEIMGRLWPKDAVGRHLYTTALSVISALDESPLREGLIYVGTDDGLIRTTDDGGEAWRRVDRFPGLPVHSYVTDVFASPLDADTVFATFNNWQRGDFRPYVYKSSDRGRSWSSITGNLPPRSGAWSIVQDHVNRDLLFVGLEFGVFFTVDGGRHWIPLEGGMPSIQARDLLVQRHDDDLVVGTFGRGAYILDDYSALRSVVPSALERPACLFPLRQAMLFDELGQVTAAWGNETTPNPPFGAVFTYHLREPLAEGQLVLTITDPAGERVRRLRLSDAVGIQRVAWDLRRDPERPARGRRRSRGVRVAPGRYEATLGRLLGDSVEPFGRPQTVTVVTPTR